MQKSKYTQNKTQKCKRKHKKFYHASVPWPTSNPQVTRLRFLLTWFWNPKNQTVHHLTNLLRQICTPLLYNEKTCFEINKIYPISLDFCVVVNLQGSYSGTLRISSLEIELGEERIKERVFLKNRFLDRILKESLYTKIV